MPIRRCFSCGKASTKDELVRFTIKEDVVRPDAFSLKPLPGRGAYLCRSKECIISGSKKGFSRVFKKALPPFDPSELLNELGFS